MRRAMPYAYTLLAILLSFGISELPRAEAVRWTESFSDGVGRFTTVIGDAATVFVFDPVNYNLDCTFVRRPSADRRLAGLGASYTQDDSVGFAVEWSPTSGSPNAFPHVGFFDAATGARIVIASMTDNRYQLSIEGEPGFNVEDTGTDWFFGDTYRLYLWLDGVSHSVIFATWILDGGEWSFQGIGSWDYSTTSFAFDAIGIGNLQEENSGPTLLADVDNFALFAAEDGELLYVEGQSESPVHSLPLSVGRQYELTVFGTYRYNGQGERADAEWRMATGDDGPIWVETGNPGSGLDLLINGQGVDWLGSADGVVFSPHTFSPTHVYKYNLVGDGTAVSFLISDTSPGDNSGGLVVELRPLDSPVPAVSGWGMLAMALLTMVAGTVVFRGRVAKV